MSTWKKYIDGIKAIILFLKDFENDHKNYEIAVNSVKRVNSVVGITGAVLIFTPAAPLGLAICGIAGVSGLATADGNSIADWVKTGRL